MSLRGSAARGLCGAVAVVAATLAVPPPAAAHIRSGVVGVDYVARIFPLRPALRDALTARVDLSDRALHLAVRTGHSVLVRGYLGEPFLRLDAAGSAVNAASPTAAAVGLLARGEATADGKTRWLRETSRRELVWHDARVRGLPAGVRRAKWVVPLTVDGRAARLEGELRRVPRPSLWPWIGVAAAFLVAIAALPFVRPSRHLEPAAIGLGVIAAAATVATAAGFALDTYASAGTWIASADEVIFVAVGLGLLGWGSRVARAGAVVGLGFLALFVGGTKAAAFYHGVVLADLPAPLARASVAVALAGGLAAVVAGCMVLAPLSRRVRIG